jgi:hypothetical protein
VATLSLIQDALFPKKDVVVEGCEHVGPGAWENERTEMGRTLLTMIHKIEDRYKVVRPVPERMGVGVCVESERSV